MNDTSYGLTFNKCKVPSCPNLVLGKQSRGTGLLNYSILLLEHTAHLSRTTHIWQFHNFLLSQGQYHLFSSITLQALIIALFLKLKLGANFNLQNWFLLVSTIPQKTAFFGWFLFWGLFCFDYYCIVALQCCVSFCWTPK